MNFTIDERNWHKTVFRPMESRLDSRNAGELKAEFLLLAQPEINSLVVDLTHVEQVDSSGLSALLLGQRAMRLFDGELRLAGPNESVRKLLELTQLDRMFPIYGTVEEAVESRRRFFLDPDDPLHTTEYYEPDMEEEEAEQPEYLKRIVSRTEDSSSEHERHAGATNFTTTFDHTEPLGPDAPSAQDIRLGAIAAGGSFGAAALTNIMMTPETALELEEYSLMSSAPALGDEEEDDIDDIDEDFDDEDADDLDEEDDAEEEDEFDEEEDAEEVEDLDEDFEDDDWDEEELEEDEEEDY